MEYIDYDIHGLVGIRLIDPSPSDATAVSRQVGPLQKPLDREPDVVVRFVEHLPMPHLRYLGLECQGFTDEGYFIFRSSRAEAKVRVDFDQVGKHCEIVCESGLRSVPLLTAILGLTVLKRDCVPLHASAFVHEGVGILATGWAKGGKTEALLAFASQGARYVGDEWVILSGDGQRMYGLPEHIRLWDWHLAQLPHVRRWVKRDAAFLFKGIHCLERMHGLVSRAGVGKAFPLSLIGEAMPALRRQLNVRVDPQTIFGKNLGSLVAKPERVFLLVSHSSSRVDVEPCDSLDIARRMISSNGFERLPLMEHYLAFRFAFPEKKSELIERAEELQYEVLCRALAGKEAYVVRHPYPVSFGDLYEAMSPFCKANGAHA